MKSAKTGPKPARIKIQEKWEQAVQMALKKKRPPEGWPENGKKKPVDK